MAYDGSTGKISAPISVYDVMQALGVSSVDVGSLCRSEYIRRWSKFKPVNIGVTITGSTRINTLPFLNMTTKKWNESLSSQWWRDTDGGDRISKYGFIPITKTTADGIYQAYRDGLDWEYYTPYGGAQYPYRLIDFIGYYHYAPEPAGVNIGDFTKKISGDWSISFGLPSSQDDALDVTQRDYIVPKDILRALWPSTQANPNPPYYGIMIYDPEATTNKICWAKTSDTITGSDTSVWDSDNGRYVNVLANDKDYYIIPFYSNIQINGRSLANVTLAVVPNSSMGKMHTSDSGVHPYGRYILKAVFGVTGRLVVNVAISTETYAGVTYDAHTFVDIKLYVCNTTTVAPDNSYPEANLYKVEYPNQTIQANSRWDAAPFNDKRPNQNVICYLYENGQKQATANAVMPEPFTPSPLIPV